MIRGELDEDAPGRAASRAASSGRSRRATTRRSRSWNGLALAALAEAGRRLERPRLRRRGRGRVLLGPLLARAGRSCAAPAPGGRAGPASSTTTPTSRTGCSSSTSRPASSAGSRRRTGSPAVAVELLRRRGARRLLPRAARRRAARGREEGPRRPPDPVGELDARARPAPARPDLRRRRARAARRRRLPAAPRRDPARAVGVRLGARRRSTSTSRRRASSRSSARPTATSPAPRSRRGSRRPSSPSGLREGVPLLAGKGLVDGRPAVYVCERFACRRRRPIRQRSPVAERQILALGGHAMRPGDALDDFLLELTGASRPRVLLIPTASAESEDYVVRFYETTRAAPRRRTCRCSGSRRPTSARSSSTRTRSSSAAATPRTCSRSGACTASTGFLREAWEAGVVLAGVSAGSICWFEAGVTDSFREELDGLDCLGFLPGSNCPHYDGEETRRPAYHRLVAEGFPRGPRRRRLRRAPLPRHRARGGRHLAARRGRVPRRARRRRRPRAAARRAAALRRISQGRPRGADARLVGFRAVPGALLELRNVEARYGPVAALRGVSLTVGEGEVVAVLGANGAGKTTTLRADLGDGPPLAARSSSRGRRSGARPRRRRGRRSRTSPRAVARSSS